MKKTILFIHFMLVVAFGSLSAQDFGKLRTGDNTSPIASLEVSDEIKQQLRGIQHQYVLTLEEAVHESQSIETLKFLRECWMKRNRAFLTILTEDKLLELLSKETRPAFLMELEKSEISTASLEKKINSLNYVEF